MDKIYKVFVSSTYEDLKEERSEAIQALLELDCIPVGMELFPASNEEQWEFIKKVIKECDYYVLILGGRYGSCDKDGIGYTEKEFLYAKEKGIPILAFLHKNPDDIPAGKTEKDDIGRQKYEELRKMAQDGRICDYWDSPKELKSEVIISLNRIKKTCPRIGWVKADKVPDVNVSAELLKLKNENEELKKQLNAPPENIEDLAKGEDLFTINYEWIENWLVDNPYDDHIWKSENCSLNWDQIFSIISPYLTCSNHVNNIPQFLNNYINENIKGKNFTIRINENNFNIILIQLEALGLIEPEGDNLWKLTPYGKNYMIKLKTVKKETVKV